MTWCLYKKGTLNTEADSHRRKSGRRETQGEDSHLKARETRNNFPSQTSEGTNPADTLIWDF